MLQYGYFHADTKASEKLCALLTDTNLLKNLTRLSPLYQISHLESFHSVIIHFAPKSVALSYPGMTCRYVAISRYMTSVSVS